MDVRLYGEETVLMIVTITFSATEGNRDALVEKLLSILPDTRAFDGCNSITFVESQEAAGNLTLIEDWASSKQYDAYKAWRKESGTSVLGSDLVDPASLSSHAFEILSN